MKDKVHPQYKETTISCACGAVIHTRSTKQNIHVEICSSCHPFFTGKQKLVDSAGRVERYAQRLAKKKEPKKKKVEAPKEEAQAQKETIHESRATNHESRESNVKGAGEEKKEI